MISRTKYHDFSKLNVGARVLIAQPYGREAYGDVTSINNEIAEIDCDLHFYKYEKGKGIQPSAEKITISEYYQYPVTTVNAAANPNPIRA